MNEQYEPIIPGPATPLERGAAAMEMTPDQWRAGADQLLEEVRLFPNGKCLVCGHLKGDHERFPDTNVWTCDDDCDEDLNGYCHTGRL